MTNAIMNSVLVDNLAVLVEANALRVERLHEDPIRKTHCEQACG